MMAQVLNSNLQDRRKRRTVERSAEFPCDRLPDRHAAQRSNLSRKLARGRTVLVERTPVDSITDDSVPYVFFDAFSFRSLCLVSPTSSPYQSTCSLARPRSPRSSRSVSLPILESLPEEHEKPSGTTFSHSLRSRGGAHIWNVLRFDDQAGAGGKIEQTGAQHPGPRPRRNLIGYPCQGTGVCSWMNPRSDEVGGTEGGGRKAEQPEGTVAGRGRRG
ncbi:hypothetical protein KM043_014285 [Ampulex compressa]|nr:hypothetical protein KM043_014285 [Ampulex compressa]